MTKLIDLPCTIRGFIKMTAEPEGDYYDIVLNARLSNITQMCTYQHEQNHILNNDFWKESADENEKNSHIHESIDPSTGTGR